jgi:L-arabinose isomerase
MAKLSPENIARLKQLVHDGVQVLNECDDLRQGLSETVKSIAEELEVKPAQLNKLIKVVQKGKMNDQREDFDELEELYKAGGLG